MLKTIVAIIIVIMIIGLIRWFNQPKTMSETPEQEFGLGTIEGSLSYPSEFIPFDMEVCAQNVSTRELYCTSEHIKNSKYTYGVGYKIEVPAGDYYVYASTQMVPGYKAYYSESVTCSQGSGCFSHDPIRVKVSSGKTVSGVDPQDWYK